MSDIAKFIELDESPEKIFGRLSESVHIAAYSFERALMGLEYLIENDRWKQVGKGYSDIDAFIRDVNFSNYRILAEERKSIAKKLNELRVSNRSTAKMLGVNEISIRRDISATNVADTNTFDTDNQEDINESATNVAVNLQTSPSPFNIPAETVVKKHMEELKREEKKQQRQEQINKISDEIEKNNIVAPDGKFEVIVVDPPWAYGTKFDPETRRVANPYPEMEQSELLDIKIPSADDSVLFLWTTHKFIWDAHELLKYWGFTYRSILVWDKDKIGMGELFRMQLEFCLVGIKGKPVLNNDHTIRDIIREPRREHSRKPDAFYEMVNKLCIGRKIDYFSREQREGWYSYGIETNKF